MPALSFVQRTLEGKSGTAAVDRGADKGQRQTDAVSDSLRTGLNGEPDARRESTSRELLGRLGLKGVAYGKNSSCGRVDGGVPGGFGSAEGQTCAEGAPGEVDLGAAIEGVK